MVQPLLQRALRRRAPGLATRCRKVTGLLCVTVTALALPSALRGTSAAFIAGPVSSLQGYIAQSFYHKFIPPLFLATVVLAAFARPSTQEAIPPGFRRFQVYYLVAWAWCVGADWLQGPYVYALYDAYGYSKRDIAQLFVAGFGSSMVFGCFVGSFADRFGRKKTCLAYCVLYTVSCLTKHFNHYWISMVGRIAGGIATSMLFSGFECWMVSTHLVKNGFSGGLLSYMFGAMFILMYFVAILSGFVAQSVADNFAFAPISEGSIIYAGGFCAPFDVSIVCLVLGFVAIACCWDEVYGELGGDSAGGQFGVSCRVLIGDLRLMMLGLVVACFEGAMFAFVFNWTPVLDSEDTSTPHGLIFAAFMMACMCGACVATIAGDAIKAVTKLICIFVCAAIALAVVAMGVGHQARCFTCFLIFEFCVGVYFPACGMLKSEVVPENVRTTLYNFYRVPLNAVVVGLLLTDLSLVQCFGLCALLVSFALVCILCIAPISPGASPQQTSTPSRPEMKQRKDV